MWYRSIKLANAQNSEGMNFYSHLYRVLEDKMPSRASAQQVRGIVANSGATADEIEWLGLEEYLDSRPVVTKEDLLSRLRLKVPQVALHALDYEGEYDEGEDESGYGTQTPREDYSKYTMPGGDGYREYLLKLMPNFDDPGFLEYLRKMGRGSYRLIDTARKDPQNYGVRAWGDYIGTQYRSRHFSDEHVNPLAHIRTTDRLDDQGKRVLYLEELQSDWHQDGRKHGYYTADLKRKIAEARSLKLKLQYSIHAGHEMTDQDKAAARTRLQELQEDISKEAPNGIEDMVPKGPFSKNWHELAMKHAIDLAVKGNYDRLAWTTGDQAAKMFSLSKQIDSMTLTPVGENEVGVYALKYNHPMIDKVVPLNKLADTVGKEVADQYVTRLKSGDTSPLMLSGEGLNVGGHGMRGFYDNMLPKYVSKYTKRWNTAPQQAMLDSSTPTHKMAYFGPQNPYAVIPDRLTHHPDEVERFDSREEALARIEILRSRSYTPAHAIDITPEMRSEITDGGQRLSASWWQGLRIDQPS